MKANIKLNNLYNRKIIQLENIILIVIIFLFNFENTIGFFKITKYVTIIKNYQKLYFYLRQNFIKIILLKKYIFEYI